MNDLVLLIKERLLRKEPLVLVTITESSGSTPRAAGARMLVGKGPNMAPLRLWGSIGGGITEHLAIEEAGRLLQTRGTAFKKYKLHSGEADSEPQAELDAICGGEISVSFRFIEAGDTELAKLPEKLIEEIENEMASGGLVYVFGGGHVAQELVPLLAHLDFRVIVFDDREEFARNELFPVAEKVILGDFEHIEKSVTLNKNDYAVIVTRGHLWDLEAWAFALKSEAAYVGVIGSKSKHEYVKDQLLRRGFGLETINTSRVHAPIGVQIKSETPAEIAVSIAAELIHCRAQIREN